jgi:FKBP-type peptidyl-prolyl cis-trans isomerase (trigger factor)
MNYENIKATKTDNSQVEITGAIPETVLTKYRVKALKDIGEKVEMPGFRKGHVPEKILVERVGEIYILEEAGELALKEFVPEIIEKNVPNYVGRPNIAITKLAPGNPLEFKVTVDILPEFKLPNYKKIAKDEMSVADEVIDVGEPEIDNVIEEIRKQHAHNDFHKAHKDEAAHNHTDEEIDTFKPEFNDAFVKTLGNFESVEDFRAKAKVNMLSEKENRAKDKKRTALLEALVLATEVKVPQALIDNEINRMFAQFESDVAGVGLKIDDYLKHIKKTPEELRTEWMPDATKRAKLNLILAEIAKEEKITADKETVEKEVEHITKNYKDIDPLRVRLYTEHMMTIEKTVKFLEEQK